MALNESIDVDVTYGYPDGTLRTYTIKNFVLCAGSIKIMGIKPHIEGASQTISAAGSPAIDPPSLLLLVGLAIVMYHWLGAVGIIVLSIILLWIRQVWNTAQRQHAKKVVDAKQSQQDQSSNQRSDS